MTISASGIDRSGVTARLRSACSMLAAAPGDAKAGAMLGFVADQTLRYSHGLPGTHHR